MENTSFQNKCRRALKAFQGAVPNPKTRGVGHYTNAYGNVQRGSTGNMAFNATKLEFLSPNEAHIYLDENIAPYVPYTNEEWISPKWKGHKNPNAGWFDRAADIAIKSFVAQIPGAKINKKGANR